MRNRVFSYSALLFLVSTFPIPVMAQFHAPTDEELKMSADPKAPGAAAVYLNIEEVDNQSVDTARFYVRIKVLQEKGKELATVEQPYLSGPFSYKVEDIKARTIHADGTVVPLVVMPEDLLFVKSGEEALNRKIFTLPAVDVGSILEYRYTLQFSGNAFLTPQWQIQRPYFVHREHYEFTPMKSLLRGVGNSTSRGLIDAHGGLIQGMIWSEKLPPGEALKTDAAGIFHLDISDIPPSPSEEWMPPVQSLLYHVLFYFSTVSSSNEYWTTEAKRWSKRVDEFVSASPSISKAVSGLTGPGDGDLEKARKLYAAVQALDNTDFSRKKGQTELKQLKLKEVKRAEDVWQQKSGSGNEIAQLYLAMLRTAGFTAHDMKVVNRDKGIFNPNYLDFDQLQDDLIILTIGGKDIVLDPGQKMCPFQTVHWKHSGAYGVRQSDDGRFAASSPLLAYSANTVNRIGEITVGEDSSVTGHFSFVMTGQEALYWRQKNLEIDENEVKKQLDEALAEVVPAGIDAHIDHFLGLDDPDVNLVAVVKLQGSLGTATSKRILLPAFVLDTRSHLPFVDQPQRQEPVDMHYAEQVTDQIVYHLPAGFEVEGAPKDANVIWEKHSVLVTKFKTEPGQITVTRSLARAFTFAKPEEYQDLRGFYQKVAVGDQQQVVLAAASAAKGNL